MKPISNYVLIKPNRINDTILLPNNKKLFISTIFEPGKYAPVRGEVMAVPDKLYFNIKDKRKSLEFDTDMELEVGDEVIFHYLETTGRDSDKWIDYKGEKCLLLKYDAIYCALRNKKLIMINGWMLIEPEKKKELSKIIKLITPKKESKEREVRGRIYSLGSILRDYLDYPDLEGDNDELVEGNTIIYREMDAIPLEYSSHATIEKEKGLCRIQRKDVLAKIN